MNLSILPRFTGCLILCLPFLAEPLRPAQQRSEVPRVGPTLGRVEAGAATLTGYLIENTPFIPLKKFAQDAGLYSSVSPSRRNVAIIVNRKIYSVLNMKLAVIDGKEFPLSVSATERDGDFFVPLEFYQRVFPNSVKYHKTARRVTVTLPGKTLNIPIKKPSIPQSSAPTRK